MSSERLGMVLSTVTDAPPTEFVELGKIAEGNGFEAMLVNEGSGDALACAQAIALGTTHIKVGTNIANIYFRHPFLAAMTAWTISELSGGRLILGLGMSHRAVLKSLGIDMKQPRQYLAEYARTVKCSLRGERVGGFFQTRASTRPVAVLLAALTRESAAVAGREADGIMPFLTARAHVGELMAAARDAALAVGKDAAALDCVMSIPTFVSDDVAAARSAARYNLAFFAQMPNYRRQWRNCGFETEVDALELAWRQRDRRLAATLVSDRMVDEVCIYGSVAQCRDQLAAFRDAGAALPLLAVSPVNGQRLAATREALKLLAPR